MRISATMLSAHFARRGVAVVVLIVALVGAQLLCTHAAESHADANTTTLASSAFEPGQDAVLTSTHAARRPCGHHRLAPVDVICHSAPRSQGGASIAALIAGLLAVGLVVATPGVKRTHSWASRRHREQYREPRFGRLLLLDESIALI